LFLCCCPFLLVIFIEHDTFVTSTKLHVSSFFFQTKQCNILFQVTSQATRVANNSHALFPNLFLMQILGFC
jgi:hypothetical protein